MGEMLGWRRFLIGRLLMVDRIEEGKLDQRIINNLRFVETACIKAGKETECFHDSKEKAKKEEKKGTKK